MLSATQIRALLKTIPAGFKGSSDDFFAPVNAAHIPSYKKLGVITTNEAAFEESSTQVTKPNNDEIYCNVPSCGRYFDTVHAYQSHFNIEHQYVCAQCKKSLATPHLLDLHISEQHDSYFAARLARGEPMYACLLQECKQLWQTPEERKEHCIAVHKFPSNFRFDKMRRPATGVDSDERKAAMDTTEDVGTANVGIKKTTKQTNFAFGHQKAKTFNSKSQRHKTTKTIEEGGTLEDLQSLKHALDSMS